MGLGILRSIVRPLTRISRSHPFSSPTAFPSAFTFSKPGFHLPSTGSVRTGDPWFPITNHFHSLTDTRFPKRRPSYKPRRRRASLKPPGPYAWVPYTPGQPILPNHPNEGSVKRRNEKKRISYHFRVLRYRCHEYYRLELLKVCKFDVLAYWHLVYVDL
ncbi:uncharacterized protein E5676_scaffold857G00090 [Cucumis melo var. makuwa]|uniref:Uncharacterized protein n=1 Tax=Cucumis melo var. makuwa TaxID=1194695 RepID=A0A5A7TSP3_CUCMM|nr:uncharacterized protein E6C27_scaffold149G001900 [Cucumis melo var. makuwa]TYK29783.1 uncharacterized protein E5676_scaffold857G00090 [Cucumis melo var. makuwa]